MSPPKDPADNSLATDKYTDKGFPDLEREWTVRDLIKAESTLSSIRIRDASQLPRFKSKKSGAVFQKLTADHDFKFYRDEKAPINQRMEKAVTHISTVNQIFQTYLSAFQEKKVSGRDMVETVGMLLRFSSIMMDIAQDFKKTLDRSDPSYSTRMNGFAQMMAGNAETLSGGILMLTEVSVYNLNTRKALAKHLKDSAPSLLKHLSTKQRSDLIQELKAVVDNSKYSDLNPELQELYDAVK